MHRITARATGPTMRISCSELVEDLRADATNCRLCDRDRELRAGILVLSRRRHPLGALSLRAIHVPGAGGGGAVSRRVPVDAPVREQNKPLARGGDPKASA